MALTDYTLLQFIFIWHHMQPNGYSEMPFAVWFYRVVRENVQIIIVSAQFYDKSIGLSPT